MEDIGKRALTQTFAGTIPCMKHSLLNLSLEYCCETLFTMHNITDN